MPWYIYIAEFKHHALYTGITKDVQRRIKEHNSGKGAKSLKGKGPVVLRYTEMYDSHERAAKREIEIKGWSKKKKIELILGA